MYSGKAASSASRKWQMNTQHGAEVSAVLFLLGLLLTSQVREG